MSLSTPVCLLCQIRGITAVNSRKLPATPAWQSIRYASSAKLKRKTPARMALSSRVADSSVKGKGDKKKSRARDIPGPFAGMNRTRATVPERVRPRSRAEINRSSRGHAKDEGGKDAKDQFKALKMQIALSPIPYSRRNAIKSKISDVTDFNSFDLLPAVKESIFSNALPGMTDVSPTPIQRLAIPALLKKPVKKPAKKDTEDDNSYKFDQFLLAAETGTGKTLSYVLPIVDAIKRAEAKEKAQAEKEEKKKQAEAEEKAKKTGKNSVFEVEAPEIEPKEDPNAPRPKAIILVPTSELVTQVGKLVKQISHHVKYRSGLISSAYSPKKITSSIFNPAGLDILVATPLLLSSIAQTNPYLLSRVTHLVVDEADSLLDKSFSPSTFDIIDRTSPSLKQLIFCSATIPRGLDNILRNRFPDVRRLVTPNLHAIPRRVQLGVVDIDKEPYRGNRQIACADIIWSIGKAGMAYDTDVAYVPDGETREAKSLIVFVNERETAEELAAYLVTKGLDATALTRDTSEQRQNEILAEFTTTKLPSPLEIEAAKKHKKSAGDIPFVKDESSAPKSTKKLPGTKVLVTTDLGSRGIDTVAVRTVILYDVPHTTIDFIHRLGRTGRMGRRGRGVVLVGRKDRKDVVREVREAMFKGQALI